MLEPIVTGKVERVLNSGYLVKSPKQKTESAARLTFKKWKLRWFRFVCVTQLKSSTEEDSYEMVYFKNEDMANSSDNELGRLNLTNCTFVRHHGKPVNGMCYVFEVRWEPSGISRFFAAPNKDEEQKWLTIMQIKLFGCCAESAESLEGLPTFVRSRPGCLRRSSLQQPETFPEHSPLKMNLSMDSSNSNALQAMILKSFQDVRRSRSSLDGDACCGPHSRHSSSSSGGSVEREFRPHGQARCRPPSFESINLEHDLPSSAAGKLLEVECLPNKCASFPTSRTPSWSWSGSSDGYQSEPFTCTRGSTGQRTPVPQRIPFEGSTLRQFNWNGDCNCDCTPHFYEKIDNFDMSSFPVMSLPSPPRLVPVPEKPHVEGFLDSRQLLEEASATTPSVSRSPIDLLPRRSHSSSTPNDLQLYDSATCADGQELIYVKMDGTGSCDDTKL